MMFLADGVAEELEASSCILTDVGFFPGGFWGFGGIDITYYAGILNTVTLYFWDDSSRLDARVSPIPSGSTGLNGARRFTNPDHRGTLPGRRHPPHT